MPYERSSRERAFPCSMFRLVASVRHSCGEIRKECKRRERGYERDRREGKESDVDKERS